ncbi:MAG: hypothetical protein K9J37_19765 [Saprospiraceae bacterium]|nr:hypothetical protein [Saprospiraceae bacterium]MCF8252164.1 hypothetical protein [Saprospiraceae bacterium]MCF8313833.1 hypothetical protein [Saprospiraceae bacterium]MCF8442539.1 hypothetical protein [Saprospiraceae bacterium]
MMAKLVKVIVLIFIGAWAGSSFVGDGTDAYGNVEEQIDYEKALYATGAVVLIAAVIAIVRKRYDKWDRVKKMDYDWLGKISLLQIFSFPIGVILILWVPQIGKDHQKIRLTKEAVKFEEVLLSKGTWSCPDMEYEWTFFISKRYDSENFGKGEYSLDVPANSDNFDITLSSKSGSVNTFSIIYFDDNSFITSDSLKFTSK